LSKAIIQNLFLGTMINLFKKLLTGYTTVTKSFNGKDYRFLYNGKPVFFDPLLMLTELQLRKNGAKHLPTPKTSSIQSLRSKFPQKEEQQLPAVVCVSSHGKNELKVSRYVYKEGNYPVSQYLFELNHQVIGEFFRIYDYGYLTRKYAVGLDPDFLEPDPEANCWKWEFTEKEWIMVEKFGHTQLWWWTGPLDSLK
jgi:hypothetical protein